MSTRVTRARIADQKLTVEDGVIGKADLGVTAVSDTWVRFLKRAQNLATALLTLRIRLRGSPFVLNKFGRCFPS